MQPIFDSRPSILGFPATVVFMAVGVVIMVAGMLWLRRVLPHEDEYRSFRATAARSRPWPLIAVAAGVVLLGAVAAVIVLYR